MKQRMYQREVRALPLLEALQAAGVPALAVRPPVAPGEPTIIDLDDAADDLTVDAVLAAHDATLFDAAVAQEGQRERDARALLRAVADGTASLAQQNRALQVLCDLVLRRLP